MELGEERAARMTYRFKRHAGYVVEVNRRYPIWRESHTTGEMIAAMPISS